MKSSLSFRQVWADTICAIRDNLQVFAYFTLLLSIGNYIFLRLESIVPAIAVFHLAAIYVFYYIFVRVYFKQKPIFEKDNFLHSAGKMLIIITLAFAAVMFLRLGFDLLKMFAKSLAVFPDVYGFLADTYAFLKVWKYTNIFLVLILFAILMFTMFIPFFAWISTVIGREQSIVFSVLETKEHYAKLFTMYVTIFGILPFYLASILITSGIPLIIISFISGVFSIFQVVFYIQTYLKLFPLQIIK